MSERMASDVQVGAQEVAIRAERQVKSVDIAEELLGKIPYASLKRKAKLAGEQASDEVWSDEEEWNQARHPGLMERTLYRNTVALSQANKSYEPAYESVIDAAVKAKAEKIINDGIGTPIDEIIQRSGSNTGNVKNIEAASYAAAKEASGAGTSESFSDWVYQDTLKSAIEIGYSDNVSKFLAQQKVGKVLNIARVETGRRVAREKSSVNITAENFVNDGGTVDSMDNAAQNTREKAKSKGFLGKIGLRKKIAAAEDAALLDSVRGRIDQLTAEIPISPAAKKSLTDEIVSKVDEKRVE